MKITINIFQMQKLNSSFFFINDWIMIRLGLAVLNVARIIYESVGRNRYEWIVNRGLPRSKYLPLINYKTI